MQRFGLRSGSCLGAVTGEEANGHMLCKQDTCQSSNKLHDNRERVFGGGQHIQEVLTIHLGEQDCYLYRSCDLKILTLQ